MGAEQPEGAILGASCLWPRAALSARHPLFVPTAERTAPKSLFASERKEGAKRSCDVGVVVPFTTLAMATGQRPWKHAAPLSGQRPGGIEAAGSFSPRSLLTVTWRKHCAGKQKRSVKALSNGRSGQTSRAPGAHVLARFNYTYVTELLRTAVTHQTSKRASPRADRG